MSVCVIGGGIIGLSIAWKLSKSFSVTVFDVKQTKTQTSKIAAGMLCPYAEANYLDRELFGMNVESLSLYKKFAKELGVKLRGKGTLMVAKDQDELDNLRGLFQWKHELLEGMEWLSPGGLQAHEPFLTPHCAGGFFIPGESDVDPHRLLQALKKETFNSIQEEVVEIVEENSQFIGVRTTNKVYHFDHCVLAAGVFSKKLDESLKVFPVKGQVISATLPKEYRLRSVIRGEKVYIVPRENGQVKIGATMEDRGLDESVTLGPLMELLREAWELVPCLYDAENVRVEVGFRPMTPSAKPYIGPSRVKHLYHATGHGRSGILLAPYTAEKIACAIN